MIHWLHLLKQLAMNRLLFLLALLSISSICQAQSELPYAKRAFSFGVVVSDIEASYNFYTEVLGLIETTRFSIDQEFGRASGLSDGVPFEVIVLKTEDKPEATEWKLVTFKKKAQHPAQKSIKDDTGVQYATLFVEDLSPFLQRINPPRGPRNVLWTVVAT